MIFKISTVFFMFYDEIKTFDEYEYLKLSKTPNY